MARPKISVKHLQIDKANKAVIVATAISTVVLVFGIFIGRAMLLRQGHQSRVIKAKEAAVSQLKTNVAAKNSIVEAYRVFSSDPTNLIGGSSSQNATGERDGDNAQLILDALPSQYDFPALAASAEKLFINNGYAIDQIQGTDDELAQAAVEPMSNPQVIEIPFGTEIKQTNYEGSQRLMSLIDKSIRPIKVLSMSLTANGSGGMQVDLDLVTYYQPEKALKITTQEIR